MTGGSASRYVASSSAVAGACAGLGLPLVLAVGGSEAAWWSTLGFLLTTLVGIAGGAWLAALHGRPGWGFVAVLGACMLVRFGGFALGAAAALARGAHVVPPFICGLVAGYVPLQLFESFWFFNRARGDRETARAVSGRRTAASLRGGE